jgi:hypothetical protein
MSCLRVYSDAESGVMNENVGASFGLSVLVVVFFAIALFQPERGRALKETASASAKSEPVEAHPPEPELTPIVEPQAARPGPVASTRRLAPGIAKRAATAGKTSKPAVVAARRVESKVVEPRTPTGPFTEVRAGETLEDVAWRVYGSDRAVDSLRKANRDLVRDEAVPLVAGALIRTP